MTRTTQLLAAAALGLLLGTAACNNDELIRPAATVPIDPLFDRYVSMGNSITAGVQSGGIDSLTQVQAYPVLLARAMHAPFFPPLMRLPGCPPQYSNIFTQTRVSAIPCALRAIPRIPPPYISNTAVPFAEVIDIYNNLDTASNANTLTTFFLGGLTQAQMLQRAHPTFVTVWIGNNDVLGAATDTANAGNVTKITPAATFTARYTTLLDSIDAAHPRGVVLIGVANLAAVANRAGLPPTQPPANGMPYLSYGSTYYALDQANQIPGTFAAGPNCAPPRGDSVLVPFPFGGALINAGGTLTCNEAQTIQPAELTAMTTAVAAYNTFISAQATSR